MGNCFKVPTRIRSILPKKSAKKDFRIATWNLQSFSETKSSEPKVLNTIVRVIQKYQFDLLAVQELADREGLKVVCTELNETNTGPWQCKVSERAGRMFMSNEYLGYLWNSSRGIELERSCLRTRDESFTRKPYHAEFKINNQKLLLVNIHLKAVGLADEDIERTRDEVNLLSNNYMTSKTYPHTLLLGDFNLAANCDFKRFYINGYKNLISKDTQTNISSYKPKSYDNIWVSQKTFDTLYGGECGVVEKEDLVEMENQEPTVSDHRPVWARFHI